MNEKIIDLSNEDDMESADNQLTKHNWLQQIKDNQHNQMSHIINDSYFVIEEFDIKFYNKHNQFPILINTYPINPRVILELISSIDIGQ